ncbi:hypothetical protein NOS3756_28310 [Nostoc sp. NIES-3756]|uniref:hypothetical protein n=1 Tax=Nostoc sp. NIES-3756 TaxID=1751286 RepID=UPI000720CD78|nr:hypothetical protein [Nostoc sp. NIES-3756]BAT53868.1 hypothetical protein NOS3756_28310 [Nostoc sp. NIES-3756]BAY38396.1 hypothetical protein NIES2111_27430 [Nostoc sp. NIES-2111]
MKIFPLSFAVLMLLINLVVTSPSWALTNIALVHNPNFEVGQKVIWLYKPRPDATDVQKIPAEVVKLSPKQVQIKVRKKNNEFVNRWVDPNKLESFPNMSDSALR